MHTLTSVQIILLLALAFVAGSWVTYIIAKKIGESRQQRCILAVELNSDRKGCYESNVMLRRGMEHLVGPAIVPALLESKAMASSIAEALRTSGTLNSGMSEGYRITIQKKGKQ